MGLFSSRVNKEHIELVLDIGNKSAGVALVEYDFGEKPPKILFSERVFSNARREKDLENSLSILIKDLNTLLYRALSYSVSKKIKPTKISCFCSSPWFISETHILKIKQPEPVIFSERILDKMIKGSEQQFLASKDSNVLSVKEDLELVEKRITSIKLNGYSTHKPYGKKAKEIEMSIFLGAISKEAKSLIEDSIKRVWRGLPIYFHTFPMASFAILKNTSNTYDSFLLVNVLQDITDVSLVHNDVILDTVSFPMGKVNIIERIEKECNLDYELASSAFSMFIKNEIHSEHSEKFNSVLESAKKDWATHFENACNILMKKTVIPPIVYIIASDRALSFFESIINNFGFGGYVSSNKDLKVYPINRSLFDKYISYSSSSHKDFFLEIESLYLNLITPKEEKIIDNYILE